MICESYYDANAGIRLPKILANVRSIFRYPPKMIPGCHITIHTSAKTDKDARLLLSAMGIPFYGKMVD